MAIKHGTVVEEKIFPIEIDGKRFYPPKGCDPIIGRDLEAFSGKKVEVLMAGKEVLAIRSLEPVVGFQIPVITCYLLPLELVFDPQIMNQIRPVITEQLVKAKVLEKPIADQLEKWYRQ